MTIGCMCFWVWNFFVILGMKMDGMCFKWWKVVVGWRFEFKKRKFLLVFLFSQEHQEHTWRLMNLVKNNFLIQKFSNFLWKSVFEPFWCKLDLIFKTWPCVVIFELEFLCNTWLTFNKICDEFDSKFLWFKRSCKISNGFLGMFWKCKLFWKYP